MSELNEMETLVVDKLLAGDHPILAALREQIRHSRVSNRQFTGVGFFTDLELPAEVRPAPVRRDSIRFGDVVADVNGLTAGIGFLLFIDRGRITAIEGYTFEEPWPTRLHIRSLSYTSEPRDLSALE